MQEDEPQIIGPNVDLSAASGLYDLRLIQAQISGTLTLPSDLVHLRVASTPQLTRLAASDAPELQTVYIINTPLSGPMPDFLANAPKLVILHYSLSDLQGLPSPMQWPQLRELAVEGNPRLGVRTAISPSY